MARSDLDLRPPWLVGLEFEESDSGVFFVVRSVVGALLWVTSGGAGTTGPGSPSETRA
ncbi:hypothetical protein TPA0910_54370 [Streptomyces hygroscopicus subsp. sporocinereus]|uniref:Uncharacterized protein n=1 Tax=Streptomyces hygroscopicus TaxID=1912 RepID=A0ABQ3U5X5_STRHY|nr:hypothetical protein TPA0910_54370 [Streptomyces hygroscopicus]